MFSPIVQEKKGCLTTFEEKKQEKVVKCFGSQILLVVYIFVGIGLYKGLLERSERLGPRTQAPWCGRSRPDEKSFLWVEWKNPFL